jgi:hypothetical protein
MNKAERRHERARPSQSSRSARNSIEKLKKVLQYGAVKWCGTRGGGVKSQGSCPASGSGELRYTCPSHVAVRFGSEASSWARVTPVKLVESGDSYRWVTVQPAGSSCVLNAFHARKVGHVASLNEKMRASRWTGVLGVVSASIHGFWIIECDWLTRFSGCVD